MLYCLLSSPLGPPLFYIEFPFLLPPLYLASLKAHSCKVLSTRNSQQRLLSTSSGLQVKRVIQTICIFKTFAGREQEEGGTVTRSGNSPASAAAPDLFLVVRTAGAAGQCVWWGRLWESCVEILWHDVKYSQQSGEIAKMVLPGLKITATANLARSDRSLGQNAWFSTSLVFLFLFHPVHIGSFFPQIWLHPLLQANSLVRKTALISWGKSEKVGREAQQLNSGSWKNNLKVVRLKNITYRQVITIHFCRYQPLNSRFHPRGKRAGGRGEKKEHKKEYHWSITHYHERLRA